MLITVPIVVTALLLLIAVGIAVYIIRRKKERASQRALTRGGRGGGGRAIRVPRHRANIPTVQNNADDKHAYSNDVYTNVAQSALTAAQVNAVTNPTFDAGCSSASSPAYANDAYTNVAQSTLTAAQANAVAAVAADDDDTLYDGEDTDNTQKAAANNMYYTAPHPDQPDVYDQRSSPAYSDLAGNKETYSASPSPRIAVDVANGSRLGLNRGQRKQSVYDGFGGDVGHEV